MKKLILLVACLLLLVSCGNKPEENGGVPTPPPTTQTQPPKEDMPDIELPQIQVPERTPEEQLLDKELTMLLREQLAGAYEVKGATFTYVKSEELSGKECFVYEMKKGEEVNTFAVATDSTLIFHLEDGEWVNFFDIT